MANTLLSVLIVGWILYLLINGDILTYVSIAKMPKVKGALPKASVTSPVYDNMANIEKNGIL